MIQAIVDTSEKELLRKLNNLKVEKEDVVSVFVMDGEIHAWYDDKGRF